MKIFYYAIGGLIYMTARVNCHNQYDDSIKQISSNYGNNPHLIKAIIKIESNFNPKAHNKTDKEDSRGLGQINKTTAINLGVVDLDKLFDPDYNISIINQLVSELKRRFKSTTDIIAAYNAGSVKKTERGYYVNSGYVLNVYSRFLAYSILEI